MQDFQRHTDAMFQLVKDYATNHGLLSELSCLVIIREVQNPDAANAADAGLRMAIQGESPDVAIQTIHYAAQILTEELRSVQNVLGQSPQA